MTLMRAVLVAGGGVYVKSLPPLLPRPKWVQKEMGGEKVSAQRKLPRKLAITKIPKFLVYQKFLTVVRPGSLRSGVDRWGSWCSHSSWLVVGSLLSVAGMARQISGVFFASPIMKPHSHDRL